jgi:prevent-host-death family protein
MTERQISATEFKAKCLSLLDEVAANGHTLLITKRGKPVARVSKAVLPFRSMRDSMKGQAQEVGNIVYNTSGDWEMER